MIEYKRLAGAAWVERVGRAHGAVEVIGHWVDSEGEWEGELLSLMIVPIDMEDDYEKVASLAWARLTADERDFIKLYNDEATREEAKVLWALGYAQNKDDN